MDKLSTTEQTQPTTNASNNLPFMLSDIPRYSGSPFYEVNNNTVIVKDDYFVGKNNMLSLTEKNKNGTVPAVSYKYSWDGSKQNATIAFEKDAFYTFDISSAFVDLAGNRSNVHYAEDTKAPNDFVVDASAPNELEILVQGSETHERIDDIKIDMFHVLPSAAF